MDAAYITPIIFHGVAYLNLFVWAGIVVAIVAWMTKPAFWVGVKATIAPHARLLAFLTAGVASVGSLWLSHIAGYNPCPLCWWQRIFMYPLAIVLLVSLIKKELQVRIYGITLATIGALIALYHYGVQRLPLLAGTAECLGDASCSTMYLGYWGFYSIPLMALTAFVAVIVLLALFHPREKRKR